MSKVLSLIVAAALLLCGCALAEGFSSGASDSLDVNLGEYAPSQIESPGFSSGASDSLDVNLGEYAPSQIESPGFSSGASDSLDVSLGEYAAPTLQPLNLSSMDDALGVELPEYEVSTQNFTLSDLPAIDDFVVPDLEPVYVGMVSQLDSSAQQTLMSMEPQEIAGLVQRQSDIISALEYAFNEAGLSLKVNPDTGMVTVDSALLYATDAYQVTDQGKDILGRMFKIYCAVLSSDEYRDAISRVYIVGHTDDVGSFEYNQELSRKRAQAVMDYCLSDECGVEDVDWLRSRLVSEGHSYSELIYNGDGTVNRDASRRVEIGFSLII